jgi:hypothetical protein
MSTVILASTLWLLFQPAQSTLPTITGPLRNTFAVAAETVIDDASAVNVTADEVAFNAQMKQLGLAKDILTGMASDDREKEIAESTNNIIFVMSACRVQAKDGADTGKCKSQISKAQSSMMETISKHKSAGTWTDGPPS